MIVINTRPASRAEALTSYLTSQGISVASLPLLELVPRPLTADEQGYLQALINHRYQAVVVVSETAANFALKQLAALTNTPVIQTPFVAVGCTTAEVITQQWQQGFSTACPPVITPKHQQLEENNEGMLALTAIKQLARGDKVLVLRGVGGRELLTQTLASRGVIVEWVELYQRALPHDSNARWQQLWQRPQFAADVAQQAVWVLVSSVTAWEHWQQLVNQAGLSLADFSYLALQARIAQQIAKVQPAQLRVVETLQPITVYQALIAANHAL